MIDPNAADIGRRVKYVPNHAHDENENPDFEHPDVEYGVITSFNDSAVFVRYGNDINSKGTYRHNLYWG